MSKPTLREIFYSLDPNIDGASVKYNNYLDVYEQHFFLRRSSPVKLLEIGIEKGGSLSMWQKYFPKASIVGLDIVPGTKKNERDRIKVVIGDQNDKDFLERVGQEEGPFDIIIDDGGHYTPQHLTCFDGLYKYLCNDGLYIVEDLHTCYMPNFNKGEPTFMDFCKFLCDSTSNTDPNSQIKNMHFYRSMVVIEKGFTPGQKVLSPGFELVPYPQ